MTKTTQSTTMLQAISAAIYMLNTTEDKVVKPLADLFLEIGSIPFPVFTHLTLKGTDEWAMFNAVPYISFLADEGCQFIYEPEDVDFDHLPETIPPIKLSTFADKELDIRFANVSDNFFTITGGQLCNFLMIEFSKWAETLNKEHLARFISILVPYELKIETEDDLIITIPAGNNESIVFNFTTRHIRARRDHVMRSLINVGKENVSSTGLMVIILMEALIQNNGVKYINQTINNLPNAFERDIQYGVQALSIRDTVNATEIMMNEGVLGVGFEYSMPMFPWVEARNKKFDINIVDQYVKDGFAFIVDKNGMKDAGGERPANAAGIGRCTLYVTNDEGKIFELDVTLNNNRSDKLSKLLNGPNQFYRFLKAEVEGWEEMNYGNLLPDGSVVKQGGVPLRTAIMTSVLNPGSGPAFVRPDFKLKVNVRKSAAEGSVNFLALPLELRQKLIAEGEQLGFTSNPGVEALRVIINNKVAKLLEDKDRVYAPGETILSFGSEFGITEQIICSNRELNQPIKLIDCKVEQNLSLEDQYQADYFKVKFIVDLVAEDAFWKLRNAYIKLTTLPYNIKWMDQDCEEISDWGGVDIILNTETTKSPSIFQSFFLNAMGGGYYEPNTGHVYLNNFAAADEWLSLQEKADGYISTTPEVVVDSDGNIVDQIPQENAIHRWTKANMETRMIEMNVEKDYWNYLTQIVSDDAFVAVTDMGDYVIVTEEVQCLIGTYHYEVEISTPRESTSRSTLTAQQLAGMIAQDRALGESLNKGSLSHRSGANDLIWMMTSSTLELEQSTYKRLGITQQTAAQFAEMIGDAVEGNDRVLFNRLIEFTTNSDGKEGGMILTAANVDTDGSVTFVEIPIKFSVLMESVGFLTGYADGVGRQISTFIRFIATSYKENGFDSMVYSLASGVRSGLDSWFNSIRESNAIYKRLTQTAKVGINGKIRTSFDPALHSEDGVPIVILHPDCAMVDQLCRSTKGNYYSRYKRTVEHEIVLANGEVKTVKRQFFDTTLLDGEIVGSIRVPMIMLAAFRVKLDRNIGQIGHAIVLPHVWAMHNEGDSDGDQVMLLNLAIHKVTTERALAINASKLGMGGYAFVYGTHPSNHPYADFVTVKESKRLDYIWTNKYTLTTDYAETCKKVRDHYIGPVGTSYGIGSMLIFDLLEATYSGQNTTYLEAACVVAWRLLYEGLGLSGWSEDAARFFEVLFYATFAQRNQKDFIYRNAKGEFTFNKEDAEKVCFRPLLVELCGFNYTNDKYTEDQLNAIMNKVITAVINGNNTFLNFRSIVKGSRMKKRLQVGSVDHYKACIYGALREGTQGKNQGAVGHYEALEDLDMGLLEEGEPLPESVHQLVLENEYYTLMKSPFQQMCAHTSLALTQLAEANQEFYNAEEFGDDYWF